ncbi:hypothetical protein [Sandaracinus amylolyticus]|uniref:hypothetical protein n=1 Tax=Sandaracinus amylolyticus TaxID=927083 RepID=UPI001F225158|nr:hypothetical protein [Sandaracinus amylolyticus]UJR86684.1 Hypothetical protein I5071_87850 [Sandaracinus amylolyticus]
MRLRRMMDVLGVLLCLGTGASVARAQDSEAPRPPVTIDDEPWMGTADIGIEGVVNAPMSRQYYPGGSLGVGVYRSLADGVSVGARFRAGFLAEGQRIHPDGEHPGVLDYVMLSAVVRLRPFPSAVPDPLRRANGLYVELAPSIAVADEQLVGAYWISAGYGFDAGPITIGPSVRFTHFIQSGEQFERFGDNQIITLTGGIEIGFLDRARESVVVAPPEVEPVEEPITMEPAVVEPPAIVEEPITPEEALPADAVEPSAEPVAPPEGESPPEVAPVEAPAAPEPPAQP